MSGSKCSWCKVITFFILGIINAVFFYVSLNSDYQFWLTREHVMFRSGFPSQANWIDSPFGTLNCYLFNVTNSEAFLNGQDKKLKLQEVGPIVYRVTGKNEILSQNESTITYQRMKNHKISFDAEASCAPDILNQTIILPNFVLLGSAAKLHDWVFLVRHVFNAITINENVFLNETINYFLWDFRTPALDLLSSYIPNMVSNCGILHNALRNKPETYSVNIGDKHGFNNFFRVNSLNNRTYFPEHANRLRYITENNEKEMYCPIEVNNHFDNSLFPPYLSTDLDMSIVAAESCRTHRLQYNGTSTHLGFSGYNYILADPETKSNCLDNAMGIKLHKGIYDVSKCLFNDVPAAFSRPHFSSSTYNWSEHFEGISPSKEKHETFIIIEPLTGIPIEEKYRFQSNIPMPDMTGFNKDLQQFSHMVVPTFWYEYDMDDLPIIVQILMYFQITLLPYVQLIFIALFFIASIYCFIKMYLLFTRRKSITYI